MWFKKKQDDVFTPQQEDKNAGRKKVAMIVIGALAVIVIAFNIFSSDDVPGGTTMVKVDQTGQTPGASMHTPKEEQLIMKTIVEEDGAVSAVTDESMELIQKRMTQAVQYVFVNLGRSDNPMIDGVDTKDVLGRMAKETDQWTPMFYDEKMAFELMQLFNITVSEPLSEEEREERAADGIAVANPEEVYGMNENAITISDTTPKDTPYYVVNVIVDYQSEKSLPVRIEFNAALSNKGRIFDITPVGIQSLQPGGE